MKKKYWIARDKTTNSLFAYVEPPIKKNGYFLSYAGYMKIDEKYGHLFEHITWENSPKMIKVKCKNKKRL